MKKITCVLMMACSIAGYAQQKAVTTLALEDMSAFKPQAGNWQIVGDVVMNPAVDIHPAEHQTIVENQKKKNKKDSKVTPAVKPQAVTFTAGKGILLNVNDDVKKDNLITSWEHGDIELELEVMLPKGSNSGIYLQGRYEVQLFDSWGVQNPKFSDIGGIYRNWEQSPGKIYMGKAPLSNPSKAPGLWQKLKIAFVAPRFDQNGNKIANARFTTVELNGVKIHDNIEVPLPTGGPIENNEKPTGPLMIQGDHGGVAFRNIRYRLMKDLHASVNDISYKIYTGAFKTVSDYTAQQPVAQGKMPELTCEVLPTENAYGITYTGTLTVEENATYDITLAYTGGIKFLLDENVVIDVQRPDGGGRQHASVQLSAGTYPFEIYNFKDASWMPPRLGFYIQTQNTHAVALHAFNSYPPDDEPVSPILISPGASPRLLRAFTDFKRDRSQRLTHTIGVGDPSGINYIYDLKSGNLVCVWRGEFVDATPMWHDRGDGSFIPRGAAQYLFNNQALSFLAAENDAFPSVSDEKDFRPKGYVLDEATSRPVFKYVYKGLEVEDKIYPEDNNRILTHELLIKSAGQQQNLYYKLAEGSSILLMPDGSYAVDDKQYYIKPAAGTSVRIREVNGKKELIAPLASGIKYSVIW
jgi:hypothetical protein